MALMHTPEAGMFVSGGMAAIGVAAMFKISYAKWRLRYWRTSDASRGFWKQMGLLTIWLGLSSVTLAAYIQDYIHQLAKAP